MFRHFNGFLIPSTPLNQLLSGSPTNPCWKTGPDWKGAFDMADHTLFLEAHSSPGFRDTAFSWFPSPDAPLSCLRPAPLHPPGLSKVESSVPDPPLHGLHSLSRWSHTDSWLINVLPNDNPQNYISSWDHSPELFLPPLPPWHLTTDTWQARQDSALRTDLWCLLPHLLLPGSSSLPFFSLLRQNLGIHTPFLSYPVSTVLATLVLPTFKQPN